MTKAKKIPERRCIGCGTSYPKPELIRIVRLSGGGVEIDPGERLQGRGAYICKNADCFRNTVKGGRLSKNLSAEIPAEIYRRLEEMILGDRDRD